MTEKRKRLLQTSNEIRTASWVMVFFLVSLGMPCGFAQSQADEAKAMLENTRFQIETGGSVRQVNGDRPSKFQETREVPKGFFVRRLNLQMESSESSYFIFLKATQIRESDQSFGVDAGRIGRYRTSFVWDQIPHSFSDGRLLLHNSGPGLLAASPSLRSRFEAASTAALPGLVAQELVSAPVVDLRLRRDHAVLSQSYRPSERWEMHFKVRRLRNRGSRPIGTGTYVRVGTPLGDTFQVLGQELPEPIDHRTTDFNIGAQAFGRKWTLGLDYDLSLFRNQIGALVWDNPFRITDAQADPPGGGTGRNRFARGQLDLTPDNDYHSLSFRGSLELPRETQVRGLFSWAKWMQDDAFLPWTLNTAITAGNLPTGQSPTSVASLPARSLDGKIQTVSHDYAFVSRPWRSIRFQTHYRSYDLDNESPSILFPGYAAFGESFWRPDINGTPVRSEPKSYLRQDLVTGLIWEPWDRLSWQFDYGWEGWDRTHRQVSRTNEHSVRSVLGFKPSPSLKFTGDYRYADRRPQDYDPGVLEFSRLRMFDQTGRIRNDGRLSMDARIGTKATFLASYRYVREDFDKNFYGRHYNVLSFVDADFTYAPFENAYFYANYSREANRFGYRNLAKTATFATANSWDRASNATLDTFQAGINTAGQGERFVLDLAYVVSFGKDRIQTVNPFTILPTAVTNAQAFPYPDTLTRLQEVNISLTRQIRPGLVLGVRYWFEPYRLDDFGWNFLQPYVFGNVAPENDATRWLFLNSRYTSYHANVASLFLRYSF